MQTERPALNRRLDGKAFRAYYYLKEELVDFCRENGISAIGSKADLTCRIAHFLDFGEIMPVAAANRKRLETTLITVDTEIEPDFVCSEKHRAFFKERIGKSFSFNVAFQNWLKESAGKTYGEAIAAYYRLKENKKKEKTEIGKQFEYNTYIRDFFSDNEGKTLNDAIRCWNYKKQLKGSRAYEKSDLTALEIE